VTPRQLRIKAGVKRATVAPALGISVASLRLLEATPLEAWKVEQLQRYVEACGRELVVAAVRDGHGEALS
jgi:hypothetical protein